MICDKCGGERIRWRCDNHEENISKYKCLDCGNIMKKEKRKGCENLFKKKELLYLKDYEKKEIKRKHRKGAKKRWNIKIPKNYNRTLSGTFMVTKWIDGKQEYFGTYKSEEDAKWVVQKMRECDWDKDELWDIREELYCKGGK